MAAVQTFNTMTLGHQANMYNVMQQSSQNCVIVSNGLSPVASKGVIQTKRPLAPAPERSTVLVTNNNDVRCKRKIQFMPYGSQTPQPASVARRNARERNRVKQVNNGFATLRQHIPASITQAFIPQSASGRSGSKKLSKVETLRLAVEYIRSLQQMIDETEGDSSKDHSMQENRYYPSSPESMSQYNSSYPVLISTPPCSEASASPTPSHSSDGSLCTPPIYHQNVVYQDNYENYDPKSPEDDDELLDAIFLWQHESQ